MISLCVKSLLSVFVDAGLLVEQLPVWFELVKCETHNFDS